MRPVRQILVPLDFSKHSDDALQFACDLARRYEASLTLLHVYQTVTHTLPDGVVLATPRALAEHMSAVDEQLGGKKRQVEALGLKVTTLAMQGTPFAEIVAAARRGGHDLIVMGTHGRAGLAHALLGSVAEKVVRKAPCAVLTVRPSDHVFVHP